MKTADLKQLELTRQINGGNPPFELEIYLRVKFFIIKITGIQLAKKQELEENIIAQLSENLPLSNFSINYFNVDNNSEPYEITIDIDFTFIIPDLGREVFGKVDDLTTELLESFRANAMNLK
ncbi:MAG: hypothetical protein ACOX2Q_02010 [Dehalobacterium sp.]